MYVLRITRSIYPKIEPIQASVSSRCILYSSYNASVLRFHDGTELQTNRSSQTNAVNNDCSLVLFGYPTENKVVQWRPLEGRETTIEPNFNVNVDLFGFSLDIWNRTWVVGAPGQPNNQSGSGATMGYAFVYHEEELHSCRSLYDLLLWFWL